MLQKSVVVTAAWLEIVVGAVFLTACDVPSQLLFAAKPEGVGIVLARFAGVGLFALGEEIFERVLVMLINEAVDAVLWLVGTPADIDLAVLKGVNYPKGLLAWGDAMGLDHVLTRLTALEQEYGEDRYRPSALLKRMVREGRRFT